MSTCLRCVLGALADTYWRTMLDYMIPRGGKSLWRRVCACVTLAAYLIAAIGFPMPVRSAPSTGACGQRVCCCGTPEQCKASGCGCSHEGAPPSCAETDSGNDEEPEATPSCCVKHKTKAPTKSKTAPVRWVLGVSAAKCGGGPMQWLSGGVALPGAAPLVWQPSWPFCHWLATMHEIPFGIAADTTDPPPRSDAI